MGILLAVGEDKWSIKCPIWNFYNNITGQCECESGLAIILSPLSFIVYVGVPNITQWRDVIHKDCQDIPNEVFAKARLLVSRHRPHPFLLLRLSHYFLYLKETEAWLKLLT